MQAFFFSNLKDASKKITQRSSLKNVYLAENHLKMESQFSWHLSFLKELFVLVSCSVWFIAVYMVYRNCMNLDTLGTVCFYFFKGSWTEIQYELYKRGLEAREDKCPPCDTEQHIWKVILHKQIR